MNWLCWHVGTVTDPKFRVIAKRVNTHPGVVVAVWAYLLELAGSAKDRGSIQSFDGEIAEEALGFDIETIRAIFDEFEDRGLIEGVHIAKWKERQNMTNAERAREWREQRKAAREQTERNDVREHTRAFANTTDIHTDKTDIQTNKDTDGESLSRAARASRLPEDWTPEPETEIPDDVAARERPRFADYWRAQPGAKGRKFDWQATWRNWCRRSMENRPNVTSNRPRYNPADASSPESVADRRSKIAAGMRAAFPGLGGTGDAKPSG